MLSDWWSSFIPEAKPSTGSTWPWLTSGTPATANQAAQISSQAQADEAARSGGIGPYLGPQVMDPVYLRSDCNCRGGQFVDVPGQPQNSYCLPGTPTGKMFDVASRGCVPIPGFRQPKLPISAACYWKGYNICLYGGVALGVIVLVMLLKKKSPAAAPAQATIEKELTGAKP